MNKVEYRIMHPQSGPIPPRATKYAKPSLVITGAFCILDNQKIGVLGSTQLQSEHAQDLAVI